MSTPIFTPIPTPAHNKPQLNNLRDNPFIIILNPSPYKRISHFKEFL